MGVQILAIETDASLDEELKRFAEGRQPVKVDGEVVEDLPTVEKITFLELRVSGVTGGSTYLIWFSDVLKMAIPSGRVRNVLYKVD